MNERTKEMLTLTTEINQFLVKRCQIGETIQWEDKISDNLNNIKFELYDDCIGWVLMVHFIPTPRRFPPVEKIFLRLFWKISWFELKFRVVGETTKC